MPVEATGKGGEAKNQRTPASLALMEALLSMLANGNQTSSDASTTSTQNPETKPTGTVGGTNWKSKVTWPIVLALLLLGALTQQIMFSAVCGTTTVDGGSLVPGLTTRTWCRYAIYAPALTDQGSSFGLPSR